MTQRLDEELLSAYLDGEVTPSERAEVERHLAEDAGCRERLEQLRQLRGELAGLPGYRLDADFSRRVLEAAEREVLESPAAAADSTEGSPRGDRPAATDQATVRPAGDWLPDPRSRLHPRRLMRSASWALIATAVGLLLMFMFPATDEVAHSPAPDREPLRAPATGEMRAPEAELAAPAETLSGETPAGGDTAIQRSSTALQAPAPEAAAAAKSGYAPEMPMLAEDEAEFRQQAALQSREIVSRAASRNSGSGLLVVQVDLSPEAAGNRALDQVLEQNAIRVEPERGTAASTAPRQVPLEMVYVEATEAQLEATLTQLAEQPRLFQNVAVAEETFPGRQQFDQLQFARETANNVVRPVPETVVAGSAVSPTTASPTVVSPPSLAPQRDVSDNVSWSSARRLQLEPESQQLLSRSQAQWLPGGEAQHDGRGRRVMTRPHAAPDVAVQQTTDEATFEAVADEMLGALFIVRVLGAPVAEDTESGPPPSAVESESIESSPAVEGAP